MNEKQPLSIREIANRTNANRQRMMLDPEQSIKDYEERVKIIGDKKKKENEAYRQQTGKRRTIG